MPDLLTLALRACTDREAQAVLGDAVMEAGWKDDRVTWLLLGRRARWWHSVRSEERARNLSLRGARNPTRRWCRAVAAVLLFGDWQASRWAGVESSQLPYESMFAGLEAWLPGNGSSPSTFLGVNRDSPAFRFGQIKDLYDAGIIEMSTFHALLDIHHPGQQPSTFSEPIRIQLPGLAADPKNHATITVSRIGDRPALSQPKPTPRRVARPDR